MNPTVPDDYTLLREAFDRFGRWFYPNDWTGDELGPAEQNSRSGLEAIRALWVELPEPARQPPSDSDAGKRRENTKTKMKQILYSGTLGAYSYRTWDGDLSPIVPKRWLATKFHVFFEYSQAFLIVPRSPPQDYLSHEASLRFEDLGYVIIRTDELEDFFRDNEPLASDAVVGQQSPGSIPSPDAGKSTSRKATIADEIRCGKWLIDLMRNGPPKKLKPEYREEARQRFGVGLRPFDRAWAKAILETENTDWNKPGPKSSH